MGRETEMDYKPYLPERSFLDFYQNYMDVCFYVLNWQIITYELIKTVCVIGATSLPSDTSVHYSIYAYFGISESKTLKHFLISSSFPTAQCCREKKQSMVLMYLIYFWSINVTNQPVWQAVCLSNRVKLHAETFSSISVCHHLYICLAMTHVWCCVTHKLHR